MKNHTNERLVIGQTIKRFRHIKDLSQKKLSEELGWGQSGFRKVSKIETGYQNITPEELEQIVKVLGVSLDEFNRYTHTEIGDLVPIEKNLILSTVDIRPFLKKVSEIEEPIQFEKLIDLLRHYLALKNQGINV